MFRLSSSARESDCFDDDLNVDDLPINDAFDDNRLVFFDSEFFDSAGALNVEDDFSRSAGFKNS